MKMAKNLKKMRENCQIFRCVRSIQSSNLFIAFTLFVFSLLCLLFSVVWSKKQFSDLLRSDDVVASKKQFLDLLRSFTNVFVFLFLPILFLRHHYLFPPVFELRLDAFLDSMHLHFHYFFYNLIYLQIDSLKTGSINF